MNDHTFATLLIAEKSDIWYDIKTPIVQSELHDMYKSNILMNITNKPTDATY